MKFEPSPPWGGVCLCKAGSSSDQGHGPAYWGLVIALLLSRLLDGAGTVSASVALEETGLAPFDACRGDGVWLRLSTPMPRDPCLGPDSSLAYGASPWLFVGICVFQSLTR